MKLTPALTGAAALGIVALSSCLSSEEANWNEYADWREANEAFIAEKEATGDYTRVTFECNDKLYILMRYRQDPTPNLGNLMPKSTSTVQTKYEGRLIDGTVFDNSYSFTDSVTTFQVNKTITGWVMALERMHVYDEVEIIIPYAAGYGSGESNTIPPYSTLVFDIKLTDITAYEIRN